jgi:prolyl-tRNA editing enzyme YbaK/EbsC (Cys-tRNA(Pro) deacylase)
LRHTRPPGGGLPATLAVTVGTSLRVPELEFEPVHPTAAKVQERLAARGLEIEVQVLPESTRTAADAARACGCDPGQIVKSLVFVIDGQATMVLCAGDRRVTALPGRPANADEARAATGFAIGGIPPLGHDQELPTIVDQSLARYDRVWCAAGTPHAVFETSVADLLAALPQASVAPV